MATEKQKRAASIAIANPDKPMGQVLREAGYSLSTATKPKAVTDRIGWNELLEEHLPDALLATKHKELLTVPRKIRKSVRGDLVEEIEEVDSQALGKGLDMAYKLKGHYAPEKHENKIILPEPILGGLSQDALPDNDGNSETSQTS